jgi:hypothetical protein
MPGEGEGRPACRVVHIIFPVRARNFLKIPRREPLINGGKAGLPGYLIDTIKIVNSESAIVSAREWRTHLSQCR